MDKSFVKLLIIWMMCKSIQVTMSLPSGETGEHSYSRLKRTPGDFSLFGINLGSSLSAPIAKAKESFSSIGNIFSPNHGNRHQYDQSLPSYQYDQSPYRTVQNPNIRQPVYAANENGLASSMNQDRYRTINNNSGQYQTRNQFNASVTDRYQTAQNVPETKDEITQTKPEIDKQLLNYIFQSKPNSGDTTTTVDPTYDFTTETGEYENTTMDDLQIRIPPAPVVASLLG